MAGYSRWKACSASFEAPVIFISLCSGKCHGINKRYNSAKLYPYFLMSLPLNIGRIISALLGHFFISSSRFSLFIMNASLQPVKIPRYIFMSHSLSGVPTASIFCLIRCSISERITQLLPFLGNSIDCPDSLDKSLKNNK